MVQKKNGQKLVPYVHSDGKTWDYFFVDSKSGVIYYERRLTGKHHKFSTRETNGNKAKIVANKILADRLGTKRASLRLTINEELDLYEKVKEGENLEYDTMNNVRRGIRDIRPYWGDMLPSEITADTVAQWYQWWAENKAPLQMENVIKYFRNFCDYLTRKTFQGFPVLPAVPKVSDPNRKAIRRARKKKKERILTLEEFGMIYRAAADLRERVLCLFMYTMATRVTETLELAFGREVFCEEAGVYRWRDGQNKADLDGFHALHPALIEPLRELEDDSLKLGTKLLFPQKFNREAPLKSQQIDWSAWRKRAGLDFHWTAHTFRHTCLSNLFNDPRNPQLLICKLYRISAKEAEETYVKPTREGIERMREAIEVKL